MDRIPFDPPDCLPEEWLVKYDSRPTFFPTWPETERLAIVVVRAKGIRPDDDTEAFVVQSPDELRELADPRGDNSMARLFFNIPRNVLIESGICPGLTAESFWSPPS